MYSWEDAKFRIISGRGGGWGNTPYVFADSLVKVQYSENLEATFTLRRNGKMAFYAQNSFLPHFLFHFYLPHLTFDDPKQ